MNKKTIRIAGWALGLSMAVAGIGVAVGASQKTSIKVDATATSSSSWTYSSTYDSVKNPTITIGGVTAAFAKGDGSNDPQGYAKTSSKAAAIRCYQNNTITFTCLTNITAITFTWGTTTAGGLSTETGTYSAPNWTGSATEIVFTVGNNGQQHVAGISVTYEVAPAPSEVKEITVTPGSLTGTYKGTAYIQCSAQADDSPTNNVIWTLSEDTTYVANQTEVDGAAIDSNGKVTFDDNVTVYAFATSTVTPTVRGYAQCKATGLVATPYFNLVESIDDLYDGMTITIGASNYSKLMSTTQNKNNRGATGAQQKGSSKAITTVSSDYQELIISIEEMESGTIVYSFYDGEGYLYAAGSGDKSNYLKTEEELDNNGRFAISIDNGVATMQAKGDSTNRYLRYNSSSSLFACYSAADSQGDASIFAAPQVISPKQKVDTFVAKYMKMNSIATSNKGDQASGYVACKTNWANVYSAYNSLGADAQELFVGGDYADAVERLNQWAIANGKTFDNVTGALSAVTAHTFDGENVNEGTPLIITVISACLLAAGGLLITRRRREEE